ncbi:DUF3365 domain-containing protein [Limnoraphis robusta]|uniref:DUF3365 domain-containing protein n=1 Tax=Limnoraphis robusta CCNP1315 TaxID=3110306 RepID=A0ABU5TZZ8_9CYAN|nr:DUF3365 domain-containing protein [Limnoraphis robusta]MEA5520236.1 DUF3365 domain-containing protein [Limnoraphis robusta CCNP1315]MEA5546710.1 DUF3365 domain-containing protein [Limnoraphis robusta CCNP1324]
MAIVMKKTCYRLFIGLVAIAALLIYHPSFAQAETNPSELAQAVQEIELLDQMRSGLASTLEGGTEEPTGETFKQVCKPVGMRAKQLSEENGWQVKQIAKKYRNPAHAPQNLHDRMALAKFEQDPELIGFWDRETLNGTEGTRYYRRISVEASCLACHGSKNSRPEFVQAKYPQDLAFDFQVGDLRGMYSVFIPDLQAALQTDN